MVYLLASSPTGAVGARLVQADESSALTDPRFRPNDEKEQQRLADRATLERASKELAADETFDASDYISDHNMRVVQERYGVDKMLAWSIISEARDIRTNYVNPYPSDPLAYQFSSPAAAGAWGKDTMARLRDSVADYNTGLRIYNARGAALDETRRSLTPTFKAQGMTDAEAEDAVLENYNRYLKSVIEDLEQTRSFLNLDMLLLSHHFATGGPLVTVNDDGTLALGAAVADGQDGATALTLTSGIAERPRAPADTGPPRPTTPPQPGTFLDRRT